MNLTISQSSQKSKRIRLTQDQDGIQSTHQINKQTTQANISIFEQQQYIKQPIGSHMDKIIQTTSISMTHNPQHTYLDANKHHQFNTQSQSSESMLLDSQRTSMADETPVHYAQNTNAPNTVQTLKQIPHNSSQFKTISKKLFNPDSQLQTSLSLTQITSSCPQNRESLKYSSSNNQSPSVGKQQSEIRKQKKQQISWTCAQNEYNVQSPLIRTTSSNKQQKQSPYLSYNKISPFDLLPMSSDNKEQNLLEELQQDYTPYPAQQHLVNQYNYQSSTDSVPKLSAFQYRYGSSDIIYEQYLENEEDEQSTKQIYLFPSTENNGLVDQLEEQPLPLSKLAYDKQSKILPSLHIDNHKWNNQNHPDNDHTLLGGQAIKDLFKQFCTTVGPIFKSHRNRLLQKNQNIENNKKSPFKKVKSIQKVVYQAQEKAVKQKPIYNPLNVSPARRISHSYHRAIILQINIIQDPYQISSLIDDNEQIKSLYLKNIRPEEIRHVNDPDTDSRYAHEQPLSDLIQSIKVAGQKKNQLFQIHEVKNVHDDGLIVSGSTQQTKDVEAQSCQSTPVETKYKGKLLTQQKEQREQKVERKGKIIKISTEQKNKPEIEIDRAPLIKQLNQDRQETKIINDSQSQKMMNSPNRVRDRIKVFIRTKNKVNTNAADYNSQSAQTILLTNSSNYDKNYCLHPNIPSNAHLNNIKSLYNVHTQHSHEETEQNQSSRQQQQNQQIPHKEVIRITKNTKDLSYLNPPRNTPNYSPIMNKQEDKLNIKLNKNPKVTIVYEDSVTLSPRKQKIDLVSHSNYTSSAQFYHDKQQINTKCSMLSNKNKISTPFLFCASPETEPPSQHIYNGKKKLLNLNGKSQKTHKIVNSKTEHGQKVDLSPHKKWIELSAPRGQAKDILKWEMIESEIIQQKNRREEIQKNIKYLSNFTKLNNPTNPSVNMNRKNKHMAVNQLNNNIGQSANPKWPTHP